METSAPKRRKTSPRTAFALQPDAIETTPQDAPPRAGSSPSRPSFASPTRASMERHNPEILRRRESQPRRLRSSPDAPAPASRAATPDSTGSLTRAMRTQLELRSAARDGNAEAPSEEPSVLRSPARRLGLRPSTRPTPRPLPPPAPEEDDELLRAIAASTNPAIPLGVLPDVVAPEPELPPTPEHPDPVVSTPPSGIHNTPSRRPKRSRMLADRIKSSSPLKQRPTRPSELSKRGVPELDLQAKKDRLAGVVPPPPPHVPTAAELRGLKPTDPDADKKKLRASLLADIARLERDLSLASRENERIRQAHLARRPAAPPLNRHEILDLLARHALPPDDKSNPTSDPAKAKQDPLQAWLASALNPIAFLPFSKPTPPALQEPSQEESDLPPPNHLPPPLSTSEALPYLQVLHPLSFTSHVSPLPSKNGSPLLQQHIITASSTAPRGLFTARMEMTVDTDKMTVTQLVVPGLEPAAEGELRPFIQRIVSSTSDVEKVGSNSSSGMRNNISVLTWAMGEWVRVAVRRAKVWSVLEKEVGGGREKIGEMVARVRAGRGKKKRRRRGEDDLDSDENSEEEGGEDGDDATDGPRDAAALLPFLGRTSMDWEIPALSAAQGGREAATLRVQWRIVFDWTGEARSEIGVLVGVPGKWHKHDERGRLAGLPKLFDELIQGGEEPLAAVRTVVCLLAGEGRS
ncbi:hypothetical protein C8A05DRAFT_32267 [Staphylotrichum tortipilum]|uniref:Uncharacterized protein n=1 Tax=Staphylotrichum tortipilum TaxID=2831512 RepID=A0AAN6MP99_9PEZI|nr:hypothetical protein C8A05DRAFT_32267 [Staphylotrichum longicolle]